MNPFNAFLIVIFITIIGCAIGGIDQIYEASVKEESCEKLYGMKELIILNNERLCLSHSGEANYIHFECSGLLWRKECKAQLISIGDNRVLI